MNKIILLTILLLSSANCIDLTRHHHRELEHKFEKLSKNSRQFKKMPRLEKEFRRAVFFENAALIEEHNNKDQTGVALEVNEFAMMTNAEKKTRLGFKPSKRNLSRKQKIDFEIKPPKSFTV